MRTLTLSIKQDFFNEILSGAKNFEQREITPKNAKKYCLLNEKGETYRDEKGFVAVRPYDQLKIYTGAYKGKRKGLIVEVVGAEVIIPTDEEGYEIEYEFDDKIYVYAYIEYKLGSIIKLIN